MRLSTKRFGDFAFVTAGVQATFEVKLQGTEKAPASEEQNLAI